MPKISELPAETTPTSDDLVPMVDLAGVVTKKLTLSGLAGGIAGFFASGAIAGSKLADDAVTDAKLDYPRWYQELGRTTLANANASIKVENFAAKKYLEIIFVLIASPNGARLRFNNDAGANYADRYTDNYSAGATLTSANQSLAGVASSNTPTFSHVRMSNYSGIVKLGIRDSAGGTTSAATAPSSAATTFMYASTSQVTTVEVFAPSGTFPAGSEVIVLGHD